MSGRPASGSPGPLSRWVPVLLYAAAIFAASSVPQPPPFPAGVSDKTTHAAVYGGLAALVARALAGGFLRVRAAAAASAVLIAVAYGLTDELHQRLVPGRVFDLRDLAADAIGAAAVAGALWICARLVHARASQA